MKILGSTRLFIYTMTGTVPAQVPAEHVEAWVRGSVSWADTMLSSLKGSTVEETEISASELARLQAGETLTKRDHPGRQQ